MSDDLFYTSNANGRPWTEADRQYWIKVVADRRADIERRRAAGETMPWDEEKGLQ